MWQDFTLFNYRTLDELASDDSTQSDEDSFETCAEDSDDTFSSTVSTPQAKNFGTVTATQPNNIGYNTPLGLSHLLSKDSDKLLADLTSVSSASSAKNMGNTATAETEAEARSPGGDEPIPQEKGAHSEDYLGTFLDHVSKVKSFLDVNDPSREECDGGSSVDPPAEHEVRNFGERGEEISRPFSVRGFDGVIPSAKPRVQYTGLSSPVSRYFGHEKPDSVAKAPGSDMGEPTSGLVHGVMQKDCSEVLYKKSHDVYKQSQDVYKQRHEVVPKPNQGIHDVVNQKRYDIVHKSEYQSYDLVAEPNQRSYDVDHKPKCEVKKPVSGIRPEISCLQHSNCDVQQSSVTYDVKRHASNFLEGPGCDVLEKARGDFSEIPSTTGMFPVASASTTNDLEVVMEKMLSLEEKKETTIITRANHNLVKARSKLANTVKGVAKEDKKLNDTVRWMDKQKEKLEQTMMAHVDQLHDKIDDHHQQARDAFNREQEKYWTHILEAKLGMQNYMSRLAGMRSEIQDKLEEMNTRGVNASQSVPDFCAQLSAQLAKMLKPKVVVTRPIYYLYLPKVTDDEFSSLVGSFKITETTLAKPQPPQGKGASQASSTSANGSASAVRTPIIKNDASASKTQNNLSGVSEQSNKRNSADSAVGKKACSAELAGKKTGSAELAGKKACSAEPVSFPAHSAESSVTTNAAISSDPTVQVKPSQPTTSQTTVRTGSQVVKKIGSATASFNTHQEHSALITPVPSLVFKRKATPPLPKTAPVKQTAGDASSAKKDTLPATYVSASLSANKKVTNMSDPLGTKRNPASVMSVNSFVFSDAWSLKSNVSDAESSPLSKGGGASIPANSRGRSLDDAGSPKAVREEDIAFASARNPSLHTTTGTVNSYLHSGIKCTDSSLMASAASLTSESSSVDLLHSSLPAGKRKRTRTKRKKASESDKPPVSGLSHSQAVFPGPPALEPYSVTVYAGSYPEGFQVGSKQAAGLAPRPDGQVWMVYGDREPYLDLVSSAGKIVKRTRIGKNAFSVACFSPQHVVVACQSPSQMRVYDTEGSLVNTITLPIVPTGISAGNTGIIVSSKTALYWICLDGGKNRYIASPTDKIVLKVSATAIVPLDGKEIVCAADIQGERVVFFQREADGGFTPLPYFSGDKTSEDYRRKGPLWAFSPISLAAHPNGLLAILDSEENGSNVLIYNLRLQRVVNVIKANQVCPRKPCVLAFGPDRREENPTLWVATTTKWLCQTDLVLEYSDWPCDTNK